MFFLGKREKDKDRRREKTNPETKEERESDDNGDGRRRKKLLNHESEAFIGRQRGREEFPRKS